MKYIIQIAVVVMCGLSYISCKSAKTDRNYTPDVTTFKDLKMLMDSTKIFILLRPKNNNIEDIYGLNTYPDEFEIAFISNDTISKRYEFSVNKKDSKLLVTEDELKSLKTKENESLNAILLKYKVPYDMLIKLMNYMSDNSIRLIRQILGNASALELRTNYFDGFHFQADSTEQRFPDCNQIKKVNNFIYRLTDCR